MIVEKTLKNTGHSVQNWDLTYQWRDFTLVLAIW